MIINEKTITKLYNDINNDNFIKKFDIMENEQNMYISNTNDIKNELFNIINNYDKNNFDDFMDFCRTMTTYETLFEHNIVPIFSIYIPCDNDDNYIFCFHDVGGFSHIDINDNLNVYETKYNIDIYYSQSDISNISLYDTINITGINDYKSLLNIIKLKIMDLYGNDEI